MFENIDFSRIKSPYGVLALFLVVFEAILLYWLSLSSDPAERVIVGILMVIVFLAFLIVFVAIVWISSKPKKMIQLPGDVGRIRISDKEATKEEIDEAEPDRIGAPDGSYMVDKPPTGWEIEYLTPTKWLSNRFQFTPSMLSKELKLSKDEEEEEILSLRSGRTLSVVPIPGETSVFKRSIPTALEAKIQIELSIFNTEKAGPPLFVELTFEHNFLSMVSGTIQTGLLVLTELTRGILSDGRHRYIKVVFRQKLENLLVGGKKVEKFDVYNVVIGIEGEIYDYLLMLSYPFLGEGSEPSIDEEVKTLISLANSFRPLGFANPAVERAELMKRWDEDYSEFWAENARPWFDLEFVALLLRLDDWEMSNPEKQLEILHLLIPFRELARIIKLEDPELEGLWKAVDDAQRGDSIGMIHEIQRRITILKKERDAIPSSSTPGE
jgi:hypothetical protein